MKNKAPKGENHSRPPRPLEHWEKEIAECLSAEPGKIWMGLEEYQTLCRETAPLEGRYQLLKFFEGEYGYKTAQPEMGGLIKIDTNTTSTVLLSFYLSLLVHDKPHAPLNANDLVQITLKLKEKNIAKKFKAKLLAFPEIPHKLQRYHQWEIKESLQMLHYFIRVLEKEGDVELNKDFLANLYIEAEPDETSELRYKATKEMLKLDFGGSIEDLVNLLFDTEDASDRLATLDLILDQPEKLNGKNLINMIAKTDVPWQQKLDWTKISLQTLQEVLGHDIQSEVIADIFARHQESKLISKWQELPGNLLLQITRQDTKIRDFFLAHVKKPSRILEERDISLDASVLFVPLHSWVKMWQEMDTVHSNIFSQLKKYYQQIGYNPNQINKLLFERIELIARYCHANEDTHDIEVNPEPFYSDFFREAVKKAFSDSGFRSIKKRLLQILK